MKFLFSSLLPATLLLAGCGYFSPEQQAEKAVSEFVSAGMNNRSDYRPGRFETQAFTRQDSLQYVAKVAQLTARQPPAVFKDRNGQVLTPRYEAAPAAPAPASRPLDPTAQIGTFVRHSYSEQTRTGNVSRDSGEFVVYTNREVVPVIRGIIGRR